MGMGECGGREEAGREEAGREENGPLRRVRETWRRSGPRKGGHLRFRMQPQALFIVG